MEVESVTKSVTNRHFVTFFESKNDENLLLKINIKLTMLQMACKKVSHCDVFEKFLSHEKFNKIKGFQAFCDVCDVFTVLFLLLQEKEVNSK